jgi:hypothetical protein
MKKICAILLLSLMAACSNQPTTITVTPETQHAYPNPEATVTPVVDPGPPADAYLNPGDPERQIDVSSERVTMNLGSRSALGDLSRTLRQDPPTRAELNCSGREALCAEARTLFANRGIPAEFKGNGDSVTLVYERIVARDCENRYIDNTQNPYNLHPPTFGCSVRANLVQMIGDKQQVVNPSLMDPQDGEKAAQNYGRYQKAPAPAVGQQQGGSILRTITTR